MAVDRDIEKAVAAHSQATAEHAARLAASRAAYIAGYQAALNALQESLRREQYAVDSSTTAVDVAVMQAQPKMTIADVSDVVAWAKQEMPMLRDDVDARVETRSSNVLYATDALIAKGLQSIVEWLSDSQNAALYAVLKEQDKQITFLTEQNDRLASEAERHLHRIESLEQAGNLWMLASDAINQLLEGQPEAQHEDQPLWVRVALLVERLRAELAQAQELTNRAKHA